MASFPKQTVYADLERWVINDNAARLVMGSGTAVAHWTNMKHLITQFLLARCSA